LVGGFNALLLAYWSAGVLVVALLVGSRILAALFRNGKAAMAGPVVLYMLAISAMVALAGAGGRPAAAAGAILFYVSDALIAWTRFVRPLGWAPLPIIVTYHVGQALLVVSLAG
jgi:uncharacterized membrane protein YhhN